MRILTIAPTPLFSDRGTHVRIAEEAHALDARGHDIRIVTYHNGGAMPSTISTNLHVERIAPLLFWYKKTEAGPSWWKPVLDIQLCVRAVWIVLRWKPKVIHAHLHEGALIGWVVSRLYFWRRIRVVADFHGTLTSEMQSHGYSKSRTLTRILEWAERSIVEVGDTVVTSSKENLAAISKLRKKSSPQLAPDGVRLERYAKQRRFVPDVPTVIYTGGLADDKGIPLLLDAIPKILEKIPRTQFVFAGAPMQYLQEKIENSPYKNAVRLIPDTSYDSLPELLQNASVGVDPKDGTTSQASGKMVEYMAAGLPTVCLDRPANRAIAQDAAVYVQEATPFALAESITSLLSNEQKMEAMSTQSLKRASQLTWDIGADIIESQIA